jgi:hypothetical protein
MAAFSHFCSEPGVDYYIAVGGAANLVGTVDLTVLPIEDQFYTLYSIAPANGTRCSGPVVQCRSTIGVAAAGTCQQQPVQVNFGDMFRGATINFPPAPGSNIARP